MHRPPPLLVNVAAWVDEGRRDAVGYRIRQATHIILAAIARIRPQYIMYLKGGLLLGLVHNSPRMTRDIDFTAGFLLQEGTDTSVKMALNDAFPLVIAGLGYAGSQATVGKIEIRPKKMENPLETARAPDLKITVQYVSRSRGQQKTDIVPIDLSFNEPTNPQRIDILKIGDGIELEAYSPAEVIAEKYRALLQQISRKRRRRQDVYDINYLLGSYDFDDDLKVAIHEALVEKSRSRGIAPDINSLDDPEIRDRAGKEWATIELETGALPEFDRCFENVRQFYRQLPWGPDLSNTGL